MRQMQTPSSFHGVIAELPEVSVDNFQNTSSKAYFLSHCHTDHTSGLFSEALLTHLKTNNVFIYMSEPSAAIITHESDACSDIMEYVKPLKIGTTTISIRGNEVTELEDLYIDVTVVPAGHCWGSVMFLFRTLYKTLLYTGDFRISENSVSKYGQLHDGCGDVVALDALYVDTTFGSVVHREFPPRSDSVRATTKHVHSWLQQGDNHRVALHTSAKYGYEFVFNQLHAELGEKVYVGDDIWRLYSQFPNSLAGVTNDASASRIHLCRNRTENKSHDNCLPNQETTRHKFLYIHFSAFKWSDYQIEDPMIQTKIDSKGNRIDVCFATHCSRSELQYFVNYLKPKKVVGFPNPYIQEKCVDNFESDVKESDKVCQENVPELVDEELLEQIFKD